RLRRRRVVLDATSGNTGVALAMVCAVRGFALELCMPDKVSLERKRIARAFGAQLVLTNPLEGTDGAIREAQRRAAADADRYVYVDQYSNPVNPLSHELGTGAEIWKQTAGRVTHFVAGVGTSGTIVGVSRALRPKHVRIVAVQPSDALHGIEGWKHMPTALRPALWDERVADLHRVVAEAPPRCRTGARSWSFRRWPAAADRARAHRPSARAAGRDRRARAGVGTARMLRSPFRRWRGRGSAGARTQRASDTRNPI